MLVDRSKGRLCLLRDHVACAGLFERLEGPRQIFDRHTLGQEEAEPLARQRIGRETGGVVRGGSSLAPSWVVGVEAAMAVSRVTASMTVSTLR